MNWVQEIIAGKDIDFQEQTLISRYPKTFPRISTIYFSKSLHLKLFVANSG